RASNTVNDLVPGVTLDLHAADPDSDVTVTVSRDTAPLTGRVKTFVDSLNAALAKITDLTKYNAQTKAAGALLGDSRVFALRDSLQRALQVTEDGGALKSLSQF